LSLRTINNLIAAKELTVRRIGRRVIILQPAYKDSSAGITRPANPAGTAMDRKRRK
jgi:hypothetical protein